MLKAASETALKDYRINVRISKRDVEALKTKALEEGIPYQTLVTSILHKYVTGRIVEKKEKSFAYKIFQPDLFGRHGSLLAQQPRHPKRRLKRR